MDFGALPPEVNSARMYAGPGAESMLVAASAWDELAAQLGAAAAAFTSTIAGLTMTWLGPSSTAMATAAQPHITWVNTAAAQAEHTAAQARAAAAAYETAFAATVPPPLIEANRTTVAMLRATNIVGQNAAAIASAEAQYAAMWAQDTAAMYGYAAQSAAATHLTPFTDPRSTDTDSASTQPAAVTQATGTGGQSMLSQMTSSLQSLATPGADGLTRDQMSVLSLFLRDVLNPFGSLSPIEKGAEFFEFPATASLPARNALVSSTLGFALATRGFNTGELPVPLIPGIPESPLAGTATSASAVSAAVGRAGVTGSLSVPPSWAAATPTVRLAAAALQNAGLASVPIAAAPGGAALLGQVGLASAAGSVLGGTACRAAGAVASNADTKDSQPHDRPDGPDTSASKTEVKLQRVLADLSQNPASVQHWHTDKAHLDALLEQLSAQPGVHAVHVSARNKPGSAARPARWN